MRENNRNNNLRETETAFALSVFLLNLLILVVLGGIGWLAHTALSANNELGVFLRGGLLR